MRAALEGGARATPASAAPAVSASAAGSFALGSSGLLLAAAVFFGGGSSDDRLLWIGGVAVLAAAALAAAAAFGAVPRPAPGRSGAVFAVLLAAFVLWNGLSILWSVEPDRSWSYFDRGAAYLAFAVLGLFVGALVPRAARLVVVLLGGLVAFVVVWALAGKVFPGLFPEGERIARLRNPVGFWNALALLIAMALPSLLWIASVRRHPHVLRAATAAAVYAALVALVLTYSRGGILVAAIVLAAWVLFARRERVETLAALALSGAIALPVLLWGLSRPGVADDGQPRSVRVHDGSRFGIVLVVGAALVWVLAFAAARHEARRPFAEPLRRRLERLAYAAAAAAALVAVAVFVARGGNPVTFVRDHAKEFTSSKSSLVTQNKTRLTDFSSNNRWPWWKDSWRLFEDHPVAGTGAGSFRVAHRRVRDNNVEVLEPHNLALQFLSETGLVGLALIGGAATAAAVGVAGAVRRASGEDRGPPAALALAALAYALHGLLDFDWDFLAITAPLFLVLGVLLADGRRKDPRARRLVPALAAALLAAGLVYSLAAPHLAASRVSDSLDALTRGDTNGAIAKAKSAHSLNPLAVEPYFSWAEAEDARGNSTEARRLYLEAVDLQPDNSETWFALGHYELLLGDQAHASAHLAEAARLDPHGPAAKCLENVASCR